MRFGDCCGGRLCLVLQFGGFFCCFAFGWVLGLFYCCVGLGRLVGYLFVLIEVACGLVVWMFWYCWLLIWCFTVGECCLTCCFCSCLFNVYGLVLLDCCVFGLWFVCYDLAIVVYVCVYLILIVVLFGDYWRGFWVIL